MGNPMLNVGRAICGDEAAASSREWLVTNGIGGYAAGTIAGVLTRCYHGLLVAALQPPLGRTLLLTKLDATVEYAGQTSELYADRRVGRFAPCGFTLLERFFLDGTTPVWHYAIADALLELRVWMRPGENTTFVRYCLLRGSAHLDLRLRALANNRDHHANTRAGSLAMTVDPVPTGLRCLASPGTAPLYILSDRAVAEGASGWERGYFLSLEHERGLKAVEDHAVVGTFAASIAPGASLLLVASTRPDPILDPDAAWAERVVYEDELLHRVTWSTAPVVRRLALAADQFIVAREESSGEQAHGLATGRTILAGYHWFSDWGRDTMIALPGLTLSTGRPEVAAAVLRTFARFVSQGMLPNRFPDVGETPEYNTADATLWYFESIRAYHAATGDDALLRELFPQLREIVEWHHRGTRYGIVVDPTDGLLRAGEADSQLTWMDVRVDGWVVTPRHGKPVEINALWYNALCVMATFARRLNEPADAYDTAANTVRASFARFWNAASDSMGRPALYDLLDTPTGADATIRPNQIFAVSLHHSPLDAAKQRAVVECCARHLLTSHGLRSLAPDHPAYKPHYAGSLLARDGAYHQGTVWGWLIGPFVSAHLRVYGDKVAARAFLLPLLQHLEDTGLGTVSEIFDGEPPHAPRGCVAQAWSVSEVLRAWQATAS